MNFKDTESQNDVPPPIPAFALRGSVSPLLVIPALLPALTILFAPIDILDRLPALRVFTDWMILHVPFMSGHANSTIYPQLALLVNSLALVLVPYFSLIVIIQNWLNYPSLEIRWRLLIMDKLRLHLLILISPLIFNGAIAAIVMLPGDPSWMAGSTTHQRGIFYAFLLFLAPLLAGYSIGVQILNFKFFLASFITKGNFK